MGRQSASVAAPLKIQIRKGCLYRCFQPFVIRTCISLIKQYSSSLGSNLSSLRSFLRLHRRTLLFTTNRSRYLRGEPVHLAILLLQIPFIFSEVVGHNRLAGFTTLSASSLYVTLTFGLSQTPFFALSSLSIWIRQHSEPSR